MKNLLYMVLMLALIPSAKATQDSARSHAPIDPPPTAGWYRVALNPAITAQLNNSFNNFRIFDGMETEIPWILKTESDQTTETEIKWLPKVQEQYNDRHYSRAIFKNDANQPIDRLVLKVRNADVNRRFWLSGSDDNQNWFIIREDYEYGSYFDSRSTYDLITLNFPLTDYKYLKVEVRHLWREPIQIMGAGWYDYQTTKGAWQQVPAPVITQEDSANRKQSFVDIQFNASHYLQRVIFEIDGPELYQRSAELQRVVRGSFGKPEYIPVRSFEITSRRVNQLDLGMERGAHYRLVINNKDDRPLKVAGVRAFQLGRYALGKFEAGQKPEIWIYQENYKGPEYDLVHFSQDLPADAPILQIQNLENIPQPGPKPRPVEVQEPFFKDKSWIWGGVVVVMLLVGFFGYRVLKDLKE